MLTAPSDPPVFTGRYKNVSRRSGYDHILEAFKVYDGVEVQGIFDSDPYLIVYDENGVRLAAAHLSRFEKQ